MGRRKYFFFDYDGTLALPLTRTIPASTREAIERLRAAGHFVGLATGRLQANALDYVASCGIRSLVADGGNSVTIDGKLVWMESLPVAPCQAFLRRLDAQGVPWAVMPENRMRRYARSGAFEEATSDGYAPTTVYPSLDISALTCIYKLFVPCTEEGERAIDFTGVPHVRYDASCMFIEPVDKSVGIRRLVGELGGRVEDVVVFGDGYNDLAMFRPEWTSIAMGNAREALKAKADYVTDRCDAGGILHAVERFGWV